MRSEAGGEEEKGSMLWLVWTIGIARAGSASSESAVPLHVWSSHHQSASCSRRRAFWSECASSRLVPQSPHCLNTACTEHCPTRRSLHVVNYVSSPQSPVDLAIPILTVKARFTAYTVAFRRPKIAIALCTRKYVRTSYENIGLSDGRAEDQSSEDQTPYRRTSYRHWCPDNDDRVSDAKKCPRRLRQLDRQ